MKINIVEIDIIELFMIAVMIVASFLVAGILAYAPYEMYAVKKCLESGYPSARITYDFEYYCVGIDGVVFDRVKRGE
jgi:hypothetical protein